MRERLVLILFLLSVTMSYGQKNWKAEGIKLPPAVCYASPESFQTFVHPPADYSERLKSGILKKAVIVVKYVDFPPDAQAAFQYAVDIWQTLIYSPIPIHITATWTSLAATILGSCGPSDYYKNFNATEIWNTYYPVVIAEKMLGEEINGPDQSDMDASFNKDFPNWYFGIDGKTPSDKYDFSSVVLHELTHGLGFVGKFYVSRGRGGYGDDGLPAVFDVSVQNQAAEKLVNTKLFANPSVKLNLALTSNWLAFNNGATQGSFPRLYAPTIWDTGSSIYHLDENTYPAGDPNSLMTPFTGMGEAIHNPGESTLSVMYHMGWKSVSIWHMPLKDIEYVTKPLSFMAKITSDYDLDSTKLFLVYSTNKFVKKDSVLLKATAVPTEFATTLNLKQNGEVDYYFSASDVKKQRFVFPSGASTQYLSFNIGIDKIAPVVVHTSVKYLMNTDLSTKISAQVTDNIAVKSVKLEYFVNGGMIQELAMKNDSADTYSGNLSFPKWSIKDGDLVSYHIVAVDASSQSNIGYLPLSGYFTIRIYGFQKPVLVYTNNFDKDSLDFISSSFRNYKVAGFDSPALNSQHPYSSPDADNQELNFTTVLKYPIILKPGGLMHYDEIVLVEPGDPGTKFGDANFFDYVIAEGSLDKGTTWKPLADGYDSNLHAAWATLWNSAITGNNSTAVPTKDQFVNHEINLLANGNFKEGDTIQVRFRLFSDPYAHGWGWMIDNLKIQDIETGLKPGLLASGEVNFFPNPATDRLNVQVRMQKNVHQLILKAFNSSGSLVYIQTFPDASGDFRTEIDVSNFTKGLYLFSVESENGPMVTCKILIQ